MQTWEQDLARWQAAEVVDAATAERIRAFEAEQERPAGHRWQVLIALILGAILFGAGVFLFVESMWDDLSPAQRFATVVAVLSAIHACAVLSAKRFPALASVLHGVGTLGAGGAIAVGRTFNMQEHWPTAVLLWALCAFAGWYLLRDQFQQICAMFLVPAWLICEWSFHGLNYLAANVDIARMIAVYAALYLTAFVHSRRQVVFGVAFAAAAIALIVTTATLSAGWEVRYTYSGPINTALPFSLRAAAYFIMAIPFAVALFRHRASLLPIAAVAVAAFALPWLRVTAANHQFSFSTGQIEEPSVFAYLLVAAVTLMLTAWGVRESSRAVVNYGIAAFALTVAWVYSASLLNKFGRSFGLIGLGVLFLFGGWLLERLRRRLVQHMTVAEVAP
jgi:uncharacterized membrane protein